MISFKSISIATLAVAISFFSGSSHAQNRNFGAQTFTMDDGAGHTFTMMAPSGLTGNTMYQFPTPPPGNPPPGFVNIGTAGQTLYWNGTNSDWEASSVITNNTNGNGTNVTITAPLILTSTLTSSGSATVATGSGTNNTFGNGFNALNNIGSGGGPSSSNRFGDNAYSNQFGCPANFNAFGIGFATNNTFGGSTTGIDNFGTNSGTNNYLGPANFYGNVQFGNNSVAGSNFVITGGSITGTTITGSTGSFTTLAASTSETFSNLNAAGVVHTSASGVLSTSQIATGDIANGAVDLTSKVTGILPVANGGTGSGSQNFVDLTTAQSIGGNKTFTGSTTANTLASSGATITGGSINSTPVGATTASTGAFTTLGATTSETFSNLTLGSIPFIGAAGLVSQDNANLFWDATNKRLAISSGAAPTTTLEVSNSVASAPVARFYSGSGAAFSSAGFNTGGIALYSAAIGGVGSVSTIAALPISAGNYPSALSFQTALTGAATTLERLNISPSGVIKMTTYSTNGVAHFTASNGTVTSSQISNADIAAGAVDLTSQVTGVLPVANGGTGSNSQNFVDLTTAQSVGGNKTFTGSVKVNGTLSNTAANIFDAGAPTGENTGSFIWQQASGGGYAAAIDNAGAAANSNALIVETSAIGASNRILDVNSGGADRFIVFGDGSISAPGAFTGGAGSFPSLSVTTGASGFVLGSGANATTLTSTATAARAISFPDAAGTLALLSDIPGSFTGTPNSIAKFTGTNTIGNSALTDNGTTLGYNFFSLSSGQISALGASFANTSSNGRIVGITNNDASGGGGNSRALDITMPNSPVATGTATGIKFSVAGPGAGTSYDMLGTGSTWNVNTAGLGSFSQVKIGGGTPIISVIKAGVDLSGTVITGSTSTAVTISGGGFGTMNYGDAVMVEFSNNSVIGTSGTPTFISWSAGVSDPATYSITINFRNGGSTVTLPAGTTCLPTIIHM